MMPTAVISALRQIFPDHESQARAILGRFSETHPVNGRGYLLCITPRSGSSLLSDVLGRTGSVGMAREHFRTPVPDWMATCANLNDVLRMLEDKAPSGYFGIKGDLFQMFPLISEGLFAGPGIFKHIYLTRRDHIGQAISLARAVKTNEWHSHDVSVPDPDLTIEDVLGYLRYLRTMERDWETVFTALQLAPLRLSYEDLVTDPAGVFERIRQFLDVQWKVDPIRIVSAYQSVSGRHDPRWMKNLRAQLEVLRVS
jgi:trehalose 2-sulfotransferase